MATNDFDNEFEKAKPIERPAPLPLRRDTAPPKPYPIKALGKVGAAAAEAIMDKVQCPDAIAGQSVLAGSHLAEQEPSPTDWKTAADLAAERAPPSVLLISTPTRFHALMSSRENAIG